MAEAVVRGLPESVTVVAADPSPERQAVFAALGVRVVDDLASELPGADVLLIAVKPQVADAALPPLAAVGEPLVVSIMAGVTTAKLDALLGGGRRVVRAMPNTPMLIGRGACGLCGNDRATAADLDRATLLFGKSSVVRRVPEALMDAVTALSGSGPAYIFYLAEHLLAAAQTLGLPKEDADALVRQTLLGAAEMLATGDDPVALRQRVTSPGGTTAAALDAFATADLPGTIQTALAAARDRGRELAAT